MADSIDSLGVTESFVLTGIADLLSLSRDALLLPVLQIRSLFKENRTLWETVRARMEDGTPITRKEGLSALVQIIGGIVAVKLVLLPAGALTGALVAAGVSAGAAAVMAVGIAAILTWILIRGISNCVSFMREFGAWLEQQFETAIA